VPTIENIREDFSLLDDWEDRYRYIIELGQGLPDFDEALKTDANKVRGCVSQVWIITKHAASGETETLHFTGTSDANIVRGLVAILFALYDGKTSDEILEINAEAELASFGLADHLTPQRSNGLASMVERIRADAAAVTAKS
jgi:cysteine desulfuration protein SufE